MAGRCMMFRWFGPLVVLFALLAGPVVGQTDPRLVAVVRLAQDGFPDSARAVVRRLTSASQPADSIYAELLYTSGVVAATEYERRIALRRVIVEYATSDWADDALLLLAQVEYANGNPGATMVQAARLLADYPATPLVQVAAFWGARAAADLRNGVEACRMADTGLKAPGQDVELRNQLEYQKQRCTAIAAQAADSAARAPTAPSDTSAKAGIGPPPARGFRVQVVAAPTRAKADQLVASLKRIGIGAATTKEAGFYKVRTVPFATRAEAQAAIARIRARLGGKPFLVPDK